MGFIYILAILSCSTFICDQTVVKREVGLNCPLSLKGRSWGCRTQGANIFHLLCFLLVFTLVTSTMKSQLQKRQNVLGKTNIKVFHFCSNFCFNFILSPLLFIVYFASNEQETVSFPSILSLFAIYCRSLSNNQLQIIPDRAFWKLMNLKMM